MERLPIPCGVRCIAQYLLKDLLMPTLYKGGVPATWDSYKYGSTPTVYTVEIHPAGCASRRGTALHCDICEDTISVMRKASVEGRRSRKSFGEVETDLPGSTFPEL